MRKLIFVLSAVFGAAVAVNAQDTTSTQDPSTQYRTDPSTTDDINADTTSLESTPETESQYRTDDQAADTTSTSYQDQSASSSMGQPSPTGDDAVSGQPSEDDMDREEISVAELPAAVSSQLESTDYAGWTVEEAYKKEKDGETFYAVKLKQGNETKKVKFDAQGNKVDKKDKDKHHDQ